jgi:hypothetical protein
VVSTWRTTSFSCGAELDALGGAEAELGALGRGARV